MEVPNSFHDIYHLINVWTSDKSWEPGMLLKTWKLEKLENLKTLKTLKMILGTCWTTFVFMSMLKGCCLLPKIAMVFSWEPALWLLNSQERVMLMWMWSQKSIAIFGYKQSLLSIGLKTKVVQHVPRIIFNVFKVFKFSGFQVFRFPAPVWLSDIFFVSKCF